MTVSESRKISKEERSLLKDSALAYNGWFTQGFLSIISQVVGNFEPVPEIDRVVKSLDALLDTTDSDRDAWLSVDLYPIAKRALTWYRRVRAAEIESRKERIHSPNLLEQLDSQLRPFDELMRKDWFRDVAPLPVPRLLDYLPLQEIEKMGDRKELGAREYDEKFHILQAPQLFLKDFNYYRAKCEMRNVTLAVGWIDIDDFKALNTRYHHVVVDRYVLPRFMECLEAHVFSHGLAYRASGDEYKFILPNMPFDFACDSLDILRRRLAELHYRDVAGATTVSIGLCVVDPECFLTDREVDDLANNAMHYAKNQGKNCVATYRDVADPETLYVCRPEQSRIPNEPASLSH